MHFEICVTDPNLPLIQVIDTVQNQRILMMLSMNLMINQTREVHSGNLEEGHILEIRLENIEMMPQIRGTTSFYLIQCIILLCIIFSSAFVFNFLIVQSKWR